MFHLTFEGRVSSLKIAILAVCVWGVKGSSGGHLTYDCAYSLALAAEAAERDAEALQTSPSVNPAVTHAPLPVYHVSPPVPPSQSAPTPAPSPDGHKDSKAAAATPISCYHCGGSHPAPQCTYKNTVCCYCKKTGHMAHVCPKCLKKQSKESLNQQDENNGKDVTSNYLSESAPPVQQQQYALFPVTSTGANPYRITMRLNGMPVSLDVDTGAALTVVNPLIYERLMEHSERESQTYQLLPSGKLLRSYTGHTIPVLGTVQVEARYGNKVLVLPVYIVTGGGPNLLGRDWVSHFDVDLSLSQAITCDRRLDSILETHSTVFTNGIRLCTRSSSTSSSSWREPNPHFSSPDLSPTHSDLK